MYPWPQVTLQGLHSVHAATSHSRSLACIFLRLPTCLCAPGSLLPVGLLSNLGCDVVAKGLLVLLLVVILRRGLGAAVDRTHPVLCSHWLVCIRSAEQEELCCSTYLRVLVRVPVPQAVEQSLQSPQLVVSQDSGAGLDCSKSSPNVSWSPISW